MRKPGNEGVWAEPGAASREGGRVWVGCGGHRDAFTEESECFVKEEHLAKVPGGEGILRPKEGQQSWEEARAYPGQVGQEEELKHPSTCRK